MKCWSNKVCNAIQILHCIFTAAYSLALAESVKMWIKTYQLIFLVNVGNFTFKQKFQTGAPKTKGLNLAGYRGLETGNSCN